MSVHTPSPWGISGQSPTIIKAFDHFGESNVIVASASGMENSGFFPTDAEAIANARLIAAAPALLDAAKCAASTLFLLTSELQVMGCNADKVLPMLRAAIAAAEGKA